MIRLVVENTLLFLLPAAIYFGFMYFRSVGQGTPQSRNDLWNEAPLAYLFIIGAALVMAVMLTFATFEGGKPGQTYHPPRMEDGKIIPGYYE